MTETLAFSNSGRSGDSITSPFKGKNLVTFGNSITYARNSWAYQVYEKLEFGNIYNGALGGAIWSKRERVLNGQTFTTQNYNDSNFVGISNGYKPNTEIEEFRKRINNCAIVHIQKYLSAEEILTPDIIIFSYGTNDDFNDTVLGNVDIALQEKDLSKVNLFTMAGAFRWSIETLKTKFPNAKLYVALPLQAASDVKNDGNLKKIEIVKRMCDGLSVMYFDCYSESGITKENNKQYLSDGLHPNREGQTVHADYVIQKLREVYK